MNEIFKRPAVFHGIMGGAVLLAIKLVLMFTGNWIFRLQFTYNTVASVVVILAMIFTGIALRKDRSVLTYGTVLGQLLLNTALVVFMALLGDQIAYRVKPALAEQAREFNVENGVKNLGQVKMFSDEMREKMIEEIEKVKAQDFYSISTFLVNWITFTLFNGIAALILAAFLRKKKDLFSEQLME
jgi:hypothetical protein